MAIRAFISTWSLAGDRIENPIVDYVDTLPNQGIVCNMYYPDADGNGIPDKDRVLIIVRGPKVTIETIKDLTGVKMLPAYRFDKPISEIPQNVKNAIKTAITNEGIPLSALSGLVVYGDFMKKVARYFSVNHKGFGHYETELAGDFA